MISSCASFFVRLRVVTGVAARLRPDLPAPLEDD
jgi:hypothetical protein